MYKPMHNGWQIKKLGEVCNIEIGKTPYRANDAFWDKKKATNNVWLSIGDLLHTIDASVSDSKEYISDKGAIISKVVKAGTLLLSFKLTLGRLAFAGRDLFTNEAIAALTIRNEKQISKKFLYYFLSFFDWHTAARGDVKIKGKTLNKAKLKAIAVHFPNSLAEQQGIVAILDKSLTAIAKATENAEKNLQNAQDLFKSYLQNIFSNPDNGWELKKLEEVCEKITDGSHNPPTGIKYSAYLMLSSKNIIDDDIILASPRYLTKKDFISENKRTNVKAGDVLLTIVGTIGRAAVVPDNFSTFTLQRSVAVLKVKRNIISARFLMRSLHNIIDEMSEKARGVAQKGLYLNQIKNLRIVMPPLSEQETIVAKLDALSSETKKLEAVYQRKLSDLDELKKSILNEAFNGRLTKSATATQPEIFIESRA